MVSMPAAYILVGRLISFLNFPKIVKTFIVVLLVMFLFNNLIGDFEYYGVVKKSQFRESAIILYLILMIIQILSFLHVHMVQRLLMKIGGNTIIIFLK